MRASINTADYYAALGDYYGISTDEDSENTTNPQPARQPPQPGRPLHRRNSPAVDGAATATAQPPSDNYSLNNYPSGSYRSGNYRSGSYRRNRHRYDGGSGHLRDR